MSVVHDLGPGISYIFTTVNDGVSRPPYSEANLGFHVGDDPCAVAENRRRLARKMNTEIVWMNQVHSCDIRVLTDKTLADVPRDRYGFLTLDNVDGVMFDSDSIPAAGIALAVMVADCVPVLIADVRTSKIAAVHMGRAGMSGRIAHKAVSMFLERGSDPANLRIIFGPHICGHCYEVPQQLRAQMPVVARSYTRWGSPSVDIAGGGVAQVGELGCSVDVSPECSYENTQYFSHRRAMKAEHQTGRFAGVISIKPSDTPVKY